MRMSLPDMSSGRCYLLRICGEVPTDSPGISSLADKKPWQTALYEWSGLFAYLRAGWEPVAKDKSLTHLHLDVAKRDWLERYDGSPDVKISIDDVDQIFAALEGVEYTGAVEGFFGVSKDSFPKTVRAITTGSRIESDGVSIELTGGVLSITGAPVYKLRWEIGADSAGCLLTLTGVAPTRIGPDLIQHAFNTVESAFEDLYSGGHPNDQ